MVFELLVTLCLAGEPPICAERALPQREAMTREVCEATSEERVGTWLEEREGLSARGSRCLERDAWIETQADFRIEEVVPGLFVHRGRHEPFVRDNAGDIANIGFVVGDEAVAVIDSGGSRPIGEGLLAAIRRETDLPIKWLILTHMHPDHVLGSAVFREAGAQILGHAKLTSALQNRSETYQENMIRLLGEATMIGSDILLPDEGIGDRLEIDLGNRVLLLEAHKTAHSDNDLTVFDLESGSWFMGDLIFHGHTPALDGSLLGWQARLADLADRPAERIIPGHGPASLPWPEGAEPTRRYLQGLTEETREAIAKGEAMGSAIEHLGQDLEGDWLLFEEYNPRNATAAYKELEWE